MSAPVGARTVSTAVFAALRDQRAATLATVGWTAVATAPALLTGWAVAHALDDGFLAHAPARGFLWLLIPALAIPPSALGAKRSVRAVGRIVEPFRDQLVDRVVTATIADAVASNGTGGTHGVLSRLGQQVEAARFGLAGTITCLLGLVMSVAAAVIGQLSLSPVAALLTVVPLLITAALFCLAMPAVMRTERNLVAGGENLSAVVQSTTTGLRDIRAAGAGEWAAGECAGQIDDQLRLARAATSLTAMRLLIVGLGGRVPTVLLLLATPWLLRHGTSAGAVMGALTYTLTTLTPAVQSLSEGIGSQVVPLWVNLGRLLETSDHLVPADPAPAESRHVLARAVEVSARGLTFAYGPRAEPILDGLDLDLPAGSHLAVVGASGIGKSTLAALICGQLVPTGGTVRLNGTDPAGIESAERARLRVYIPQEAHVFSATLRDNLRYLNADASDVALDRAVEAVGMAALRDRLGGYDAVVQPAALSAGERQLIALTRAWLSPASLAVLDEATCHLDPAAEARAEQAFAARPGTVIVIAHRITSARRAETVLVLDGVHTRAGSHHQLLTASPMYRDLVGHWDDGSPEPVPARRHPRPVGSARPLAAAFRL